MKNERSRESLRLRWTRGVVYLSLRVLLHRFGGLATVAVLVCTSSSSPPSSDELAWAGRAVDRGELWYSPLPRLPTRFALTTAMQSQELDQKIQEVCRRIQTERKILNASQQLRQATPNPEVLRRNDAKIKETERSLEYFEETLRELQARKLQAANRDDPARSGPLSTYGGPRGTERDRALPPTPQNYGNAPPYERPGSSYQTDAVGVPKAKTYSALDLIKADTPHTTAKISKMLHQLEFKLQVEKQYKEGIAKMSTLYQADGDKKSRADAETKRVESDKKITLLQSALKRYKTLHILDDADDDDQAGER